MPDARLEVTDALGRRIVPIAKAPFEIGRRETNDLRLAGQRSVARPRRDRRSRTTISCSATATRATAPTSTASRSPSARSRTAIASGSAAAAAPRWCSCWPIRRRRSSGATTTAIGDLRQIAVAARGPARARLRPRAGRRAVAGAGFGDRGQRRRARLHHAGGADRRARVQDGARQGRGRRCPGSSFATSRKIPEEVFRTGEPRIVADLLDGELANVHMGTVALGIRNVLCVPLRLVRYLDKAEAVGEERRIGVLYLDSREKGHAAVELDPRGARDARHRGRGRDRERPALSRDDGEGADGAGDADRGGDPAGAAPEGRPQRRVLQGGRGVAAVPIDRRRLLRLRRSAERLAGLRARRRRRQGAARGAPERDDAGDLRRAGGVERSAVADDQPRQPGALPPRASSRGS